MKRCLALLLTLGLTLCLCACGKTGQPAYLPPAVPPAELPQGSAEEPSAQNGYALSTRQCVEQLYGAGDSQRQDMLADIQLDLPKVEALPQIDAYYQAVMEDLERIVQGGLGEAEKRLTDAKAGGGDFQPVRCYTDRLEECGAEDYRVECNDGQTLSILRKVVFDWDQGMPVIQYFGETFDCASQGRMQLGDFFDVPEEVYLPRLEEIALRQLPTDQRTPAGQEGEALRERLELDPLNFIIVPEGHLGLVLEDQTTENPFLAEIGLYEINDLLKEQWKVQ